MLLSLQGFGHFVLNINNQDAAIETDRMVLILDGCSGAKNAEVGTRLFTQLFSRKEGYSDLNNFELNIKNLFEEILRFTKQYYDSEEELEKFIMDNLLFTIIALFEEEDRYVVKIFGDGYVITQNCDGNISYIRFSYGKYPPYYAYKYCKDMEFEGKEFHTFEFPKDQFSRIFIGTDGVMPLAKSIINFDPYFKTSKVAMENMLTANRQKLDDDTTIATIGDVTV